MTGYTPDVALIHLGSNDAIQGNSAISSVGELNQVIDILRQDNPNVTIFLTQLIPAVDGGFNNRIQQLNSLIPGIVADKNQSNSPVILVDQSSGFNANTDTYDGVHPNNAGEAKMAQKWFDALKNYFDSVNINPDGGESPPLPTNNSPIAGNDSFTFSENSSNNPLNVLVNDSDSDGDTLAVSIDTQPANGTLSINQNNLFYTPDSDFTGVDTFIYQVDDGKGASDTATVNLSVTNVNDIPVVGNDSVATNEDTAVTIDVLANDSDADGDNLTIASVASPNNGFTSIVDNQIVYTPAANFNGIDSFSYEISDGNGGSETATVSINVAAVNDKPVAQNDAATTKQDTGVSINVLANDNDIDGDNLTVISANPGSNGNTTIIGNEIVYIPEANFIGEDSFSYEISDGNGVSNTAQVNVTVSAADSNNRFARVNDGLLTLYTFDEGSGDTVFDVSGVGTALNLEIDNLSAANWGDGVLNINAPNLIASNGVANKLINGITATQEITMEAWVTPGNRSQNGPARIATLSSNIANRNFTLGQAGDDYNVRFRTTTTGNNGVGTTVSSTGGLLSTELTHVIYTREADGDASLYINNQLVASENIGGNLSNWDDSYRFALGNELTSNRPWLGSLDLFAVYNQAFDAAEVEQNFLAGSEDSPIPLTPTPSNNIPVVTNDSATTNEDTAATINVLANDSDADGDNLTIASVASASNGFTKIVDNEIVYTPAANFNGIDSFSYEISDGNGGSETATVTVNVAAVNDKPVAQNDAATTKQDTAVSINVLANDSDVDGDNLTIASVASANNGVTAIVDNQIVYTPEAGFSGEDSFIYSIDDGSGVSNSAQVNVTVSAADSNNRFARVNDGLLTLYTFDEGSGDTVFDVSGVGTALNLEIDDLTRATWGDGVLNINAPNLIASNGVADKLIDGITATQEITMEAWVTPGNTTQNGPARIATLSTDIGNRNFTLGQAGDDYNVRLRTTTTGNNGVGTTVSSQGGLLNTELTHVVYTRSSDGDASLYIDNQLVASENIGGDFSNWDDNYRLGIGNEFHNGNRPWLGSLDMFAVYNQAFDANEVEQNFLVGF